MPARFEVGQRYRRVDLHARYGGQRQSGIVTPRGHPFILLVSGRSGAAYGYDDEWTEDGLLRYFGQGQRGDMAFTHGNLAIRDHAANGKELHLFDDVGKGFLRYRGEMACCAFEWVTNADVDGARRRAIAFWLVPVAAADSVAGDENPEASSRGRSLAELRAEALGRPSVSDAREALRQIWRRSRALRTYVLARAGGSCEGCREGAPFVTPSGEPFLEAHHTRRLSDGGPDDPQWVIALCPNCHRRAHHSHDATLFNDELIARLSALEAHASGRPPGAAAGTSQSEATASNVS